MLKVKGFQGVPTNQQGVPMNKKDVLVDFVELRNLLAVTNERIKRLEKRVAFAANEIDLFSDTAPFVLDDLDDPEDWIGLKPEFDVQYCATDHINAV